MKKSIIIEKLKEIKGLKNEGDVAKLLGMGKSALSDYKKRDTVPYKKIIEFCIKEGISLDKVFASEQMPSQVSEPSTPYGSHFNALCKKIERILSEGNVDDKAKVLGIIEAVYNEICQRKEAESAAAAESDDDRYRKSA